MGVVVFLFITFLMVVPMVTFGDVMISEVMYNPRILDSHFEYIEIFNSHQHPVQLGGWKLTGMLFLIKY